MSGDEIYKKKEEVAEDENSKKVLSAANASKANKSRPVSYFVGRVALTSRATLSSAILKVRNCWLACEVELS